MRRNWVFSGLVASVTLGHALAARKSPPGRSVGVPEVARRFWPRIVSGVALLAFGLAASPFATLLLPAPFGLPLVVPFCVLAAKPHQEATPEPEMPFDDEHALVSRAKHLVS